MSFKVILASKILSLFLFNILSSTLVSYIQRKENEAMKAIAHIPVPFLVWGIQVRVTPTAVANIIVGDGFYVQMYAHAVDLGRFLFSAVICMSSSLHICNSRSYNIVVLIFIPQSITTQDRHQ
jgi:hypothetical protein